MPRNFYYGKDADIVTGSANFASLIATGFASYGLTSAQSTAFGTLNTALQTQAALASHPSTRTPVTIGAKDIAIVNMRKEAINLAKIVYATQTVDDSQLVALGLLPRPSRAPVPVPAERPEIDIVSVIGNTVRIRLHRESSPKRGKPDGVDGAQVYSAVATEPPTTEAGWTFEGSTSRTLMDVSFPSAAPGAQVWFTATWFNNRKQTGPSTAAAVGTRIAGGSAMAA